MRQVPTDILFNPMADKRLHCPSGVQDHWELLSKFIGDSHVLTNMILESLSDSLGITEEDRFETRHLSNVPSTSIAALQYYPLADLPEDTSVGHFAHTDAGSLTVLFNSDWGLQAYSSKDDTWEHVAPRANCAIINVGDALKFMSGFKLTSSLHRVVPWHRSTTSGPRYAAIFFLRPNNDAKLVDGEGVEWTAGEWLKRKFQNYRIPHSEQKMNSISTGRKGFTGLLEVTPESSSVAENL